MISHRHKCIFIHIPKTGGSSINPLLWPGKRTEADLWMGFVDRFRNKYQTGGLQHLLARYVREEVGSEVFASYFKFAFVRNPFDRLVSQYAYLSQRADLREYLQVPEGTPFRDYVRIVEDSDHVQVKPQIEFTHDVDGTQLVDFIGRFERYEEGFNHVMTVLGLPDLQLPHNNQSVRERDYRQYYDDETAEIVAVRYAADLAAFGYSFDSQ